jgi:hypothetical protein
MGSDNFFSKMSAANPISQALHLPGYNTYAKGVAQRNAGATDVNGGAYNGIAPTLAAANAGYQPGGPGAPAGWAPINLGSNPSGLFGFATKTANASGNVSEDIPKTPSFSMQPAGVQQSVTQNPNQSAAYVNAARGAAPQQGNQYGY